MHHPAWPYDEQAVASLLLSCAIGLCMCHAQFLLRNVVSATFFAMVGIVCKLATVVINYFIWDKHASPLGIASLLIWYVVHLFYTPYYFMYIHNVSTTIPHCSILAGALYQQAPIR